MIYTFDKQFTVDIDNPTIEVDVQSVIQYRNNKTFDVLVRLIKGTSKYGVWLENIPYNGILTDNEIIDNAKAKLEKYGTNNN